MKNRNILLPVIIITFLCFSCKNDKADLILYNAEVYTMDSLRPWASTLIIQDNIIRKVLQDDTSFDKWKDDSTRLIDLDGAFVVPGFIDAHVHFNRAGSLINDANLMTVSNDDALASEIKRVADILDDGEWITGGLWGAYEEWKLGAKAATDKKDQRWKPGKSVIDPFTAENPCFLNNYDYSMFLANSKALDKAGLTGRLLPGMEAGEDGKPTGLIYRGSDAVDIIRDIISPKSDERLLNENRAALDALSKAGIVEIHDIAVPSQTGRFYELQKNDELTCRVWLRPDLSRVDELTEEGFTMGMHPFSGEKDPFLRYGALKGYIDGIMGTHGALFFEPYNDQPGNYGHYRRHTSNDPDLAVPDMDKMYNMIKKGYEAGFVSNVHAIGTKGVSLMLDTYERLMEDIGSTLDGFRVIHAQVVRPEDMSRFSELNVIAEVNPYHISDDMRWMEERIGHERCRGAYAFKSLLENGAMLSFGSDWPGTSAAEYLMHPRNLIHAAVNRTTLNHEPEGGWFPEEKISVHEALKAYTVNNAYAAFEDDRRGMIREGMLADIAVSDLNLIKCNPENILDMNILMTVVDGKIVYEQQD